MSEKRGPCPAAEYGSRGEWTCAVHGTADPGSCYEPRDESACRNYDPKNGRSGDVCLVCGFGPAVHVASLAARVKELEGELAAVVVLERAARQGYDAMKERASRAEALLAQVRNVSMSWSCTYPVRCTDAAMRVELWCPPCRLRTLLSSLTAHEEAK